MSKCYAAYSKREVNLNKCSSGAVFLEIAIAIIKKGGVVFGCTLDNNYVAKHIMVDNFNDLNKILKSKYIFSNMGDSFTMAKQNLEIGRIVLFCGTPCQIFALKKFLKKDFENLITADLVCHGVPDYSTWKKYVSDCNISGEIDFRYKKDSWEHFCFKHDDIIENINNNLYMTAFLNNFSLRKSCFNCKHKGENRLADITLGDFWGLSKIDPSFFNPRGTSLVIIRNKIDFLLPIIKESCMLVEEPLDESVKNNSAYNECPSEPDNAKRFRKAIRNNKLRFDIIVKRYCKINLIDKIRYWFHR